MGLAPMVVVIVVLMTQCATTTASDAGARELLNLKPNPGVVFTCSGRGPTGSLCGTSACPCSNRAYYTWCNGIKSGLCPCPFNVCTSVNDQGLKIASLERSNVLQSQAIAALEAQVPDTQIVTYENSGNLSTCGQPQVSVSCPENYTAIACSCDTDIADPVFASTTNALYVFKKFTNGCTCRYTMTDGNDAPANRFILAQVTCKLTSTFTNPPTVDVSGWGANGVGWDGCGDKVA